MSFADPGYDNSPTLPSVLFRSVEEGDLRDIRRGLIIGEPDNQMLIVTDERLYRIYQISLQRGDQRVINARDTYLNPESEAYSDQYWNMVGVHCFKLCDISQDLINSIRLIEHNNGQSIEYSHHQVLRNKES